MANKLRPGNWTTTKAVAVLHNLDEEELHEWARVNYLWNPFGDVFFWSEEDVLKFKRSKLNA